MQSTSISLKQNFFVAHNSEIQFAAIIGGIIVFFLIEGFFSRRTTNANQTNRWISNIALTIFNHFFILFCTVVLVSTITKSHFSFPSLQFFKESNFTSFIAIFFILEFMNYWIHRSLHSFPLLWKLHSVHHSDTEMDVTTSHRHHPLEALVSFLIGAPLILLLGASMIPLIFYSLLHTSISLFSHSNIVLPEKLDKVLRLFIVTPDFHRMHHSSDQIYTDSNYSEIFPWFDYLFKTASQKPYQEIPDMELGLETFREAKDNRIDKLLITPFLYKKNISKS